MAQATCFFLRATLKVQTQICFLYHFQFIEGKQGDPSDDEETDESEPEIESTDEADIKRIESLNILEKVRHYE